MDARREWIVALPSRHKMLAANPRVVGWGPIFSIQSFPFSATIHLSLLSASVGKR